MCFCLTHADHPSRGDERAVTLVELELSVSLRLPVSLGWPPPSGKMTVSCKTTCQLTVFTFDFVWFKGVHLHQRQLVSPASDTLQCGQSCCGPLLQDMRVDAGQMRLSLACQ